MAMMLHFAALQAPVFKLGMQLNRYDCIILCIFKRVQKRPTEQAGALQGMGAACPHVRFPSARQS